MKDKFTTLVREVGITSMKECPVCGYKTNSHLKVRNLDEYNGEYCMKCWAKWISENLPRMK